MVSRIHGGGIRDEGDVSTGILLIKRDFFGVARKEIVGKTSSGLWGIGVRPNGKCG